jgi:hypothetical protein
MRIVLAPFPARVSFPWFNDLSVDDMLNHAATLPPRSAIFFFFPVLAHSALGQQRQIDQAAAVSA